MSNGDKPLEGRVTTVEALMQERKEDTMAWRLVVEKRFDGSDKKLDQLLKNGKNLVTIDVLKDSFTAHVTSCPSRSPSTNPGPKASEVEEGGEKIDLILRGYRGLGIVGSMLVMNAMLTLIVMKLLKVF